MIKNDNIKPTFEEFKSTFSISQVRQEEIFNTYLKNTIIEEVGELINEIQTNLYKRACASNNNINKNVEDFKLINCFLSDSEIHILSQKYLKKEDVNDSYVFIFLTQMSIELNEPNSTTKLQTVKKQNNTR